MPLSLTRLRRSFILFAIVMSGALILALAPAAGLADQHEETRSIEAFQPITISADSLMDLELLAEDLDPLTMLLIFTQLQELGEIDTDMSEESFREVDSLDDVIEHLDGDFAVPGYLPDGFSDTASNFGVGDAGYVAATLNVRPARMISQLLGIDPNWLPSPSEADSVTMTLEVPASGMAVWSARFEMLIVGQIAVPHLDIPESVDLDALRTAILEDPRLPDELADQLGAIDDWENVIPVPVPEGAEYTELTIGGGAAFMLTMDDEGGAVVWEVDGVLYVVAGNLSSGELQQVAESMQ